MSVLEVYSLSELESYHLEISGRIDLSELHKINASPKTLLYFRGTPFKFRVVPSEAFSFLPGQKIVASFSYVTWYFQDNKSGQINSIDFYLIDLDQEIPSSILDVILYHEICEIVYTEKDGLGDEEAHERAREDEMSYVKPFLSPQDKAIYNDFCRREGETERIVEEGS